MADTGTVTRIRVLNGSGHEDKVFDMAVTEQAVDAQQQFAQLIKNGMVAVAKVAPDQPGEFTRDFNPEVHDYTVMPRWVGG